MPFFVNILSSSSLIVISCRSKSCCKSFFVSRQTKGRFQYRILIEYRTCVRIPCSCAICLAQPFVFSSILNSSFVAFSRMFFSANSNLAKLLSMSASKCTGSTCSMLKYMFRGNKREAFIATGNWGVKKAYDIYLE